MNCAQARELAPEFALGVLSGAERAAMVDHVGDCVRCHAFVVELTEVADALPLLAPEIEPRSGFEGRVLTRLRSPRRMGRRRLVAAVAAAAAAATIVSITIVRVVEAGDTTGTSGAVAARPVVAPMVASQSGLPAGWMSVAGGHAVTLAVEYGVAAGPYRIQLQPAEGEAVAIGAMDIDATGRGFWAGKSESRIGGADTIALVDTAGHEVCHGTVVTSQ